MVTHQLQVERRTGKVRRSKTDVLPTVRRSDKALDWSYFILSRNVSTDRSYVLSVVLCETVDCTLNLLNKYTSLSASNVTIVVKQHTASLNCLNILLTRDRVYCLLYRQTKTARYVSKFA